MRSPAAVIAIAVLAIVAASCSPAVPASTTTTPEVTTTSTDTTVTTIPLETAPRPIDPIEPVTTADVARAAIVIPEGYGTDSDRNASDLAIAAAGWLPPVVVDEVVTEVLSTPDETPIGIVSVIPPVEWRGAPALPSLMIEFATGTSAESGDDGVYETSTADGTPLFVWSTGDGFLVSIGDDAASARAYLATLQANRTPNPVWGIGSCLELPDGGLPYAPFPMDLVVACDGPHDAEVIASDLVATDSAGYDGEAIERQRSYDCEAAYEATFGPEIDHRPSLVTYMPDEDEWNRGDRYRACVVTLAMANGMPERIEGPMIEVDDLAWDPTPGDCLDDAIKASPLSCSAIHIHEYLGTADVDATTWPDDGEAGFDAACSTYEEVIVEGPVDVVVWAHGLGPYAFEQGRRTVRCFASALGDAIPTYVAGSFTEAWRIVGDTVAA